MKIEVETKELTALLDYIKGQREPVGDIQSLAKELVRELPQEVSLLSRRI